MTIKNIFAFHNFYIFLWLFYSLQSLLLGGRGNFISQFILLFLIIVSIYHAYYAFSHYKVPPFVRALLMLILMFTIYGFILILSGKKIRYMSSGVLVRNYTYLKSIYISLLPFFSFYVFTVKQKLNISVLRNWTFVFFATVALLFFKNQQDQMTAVMEGDFEFTNNFGYEFLALIPLLALWSNKRIVQYMGLAIVLFFLLYGMKRGAILIGALCILLFMYRTIMTASVGKKKWLIFLSVIIILIGLYYVTDLINNSDYFNRRIEQTLEGNTSGRDRLFSVFLDYFLSKNSDIGFFLGNGANATLTISSNYAHNDWLEIAINQGVLGLFVYLLYWISSFKLWKNCTYSKDIRLSLELILVICFLKSLFSMSYKV